MNVKDQDIAAMPASSVRRLSAVEECEIENLADVLIDCVEGGASIGFMLPLARERAVTFWRKVAQAVADGRRALLVVEDEHGICGTVQLVLDQPDNQPHRADLSKMLVHRRARRRGLGAALMRAAETTARECGRTLLVLDTGSDDAERLYERSGWVRVGTVPGYALWPQGGLCASTIYYRDLGDPSHQSATPLTTWHRLVQTRDASGLDALLADDVVFHSPVVHTPQAGKSVTKKYLAAAFQVFFNESFRYVRELAGERDVILEFQVEIDGIGVNGVDLIRWNDAGKIIEFKVMLRPLKAINLIHQKMAAMLQR